MVLLKKKSGKSALLATVSACLVVGCFGYSPLTSTSANKVTKETVVEATDHSVPNVVLTGGSNFSVILREDGKLFTFGKNNTGTLGQSDLINRSYPIEVPSSRFNNEKIVDVKAHYVGVLVLTETGKVYNWGNSTTSPKLIYENSHIAGIEFGASSENNVHQGLYLLMDDGTIKVSGSNYQGQFSNGLTGYGALGQCTKSYNASITDFSHTILLSVQHQECDDDSGYKEIIKGTEIPLTNVAKMFANPGAVKNIALTNDNELYVWGNSSKFVQTLKSSTDYEIMDIAYTSHPIFLTKDRRLYYYPSLTSEPVEITLKDSTSSIASILGTTNNLFVLDDEGRLYAIGKDNEYGQMGPNIPSSGVGYETTQAAFTGIDNVKTVGAGMNHTLIQYKDGGFATFGRNAYGELSVTDQNSKTVFTKIEGLTNVSHVHATNKSSYASTEDNGFYSWGGSDKEYILGRSGPLNLPGLVKDFSDLGEIEDIGGYTRSWTAGHILLNNGTTWVFDHSAYWGTGNPKPSRFRLQEVINHNTEITGPSELVSVVQANHGGAAVGSDGKLYSWGHDSNYGLGLGILLPGIEGGYAESYQEVVAPEDETFVKVYGGQSQRLALTENGDVYAWGQNASNRFGSTESHFKVATKIQNLPQIKEVAVGHQFNLFLDVEGNVWSVGYNFYGALGLGDTANRKVPMKIPTLSNVEHIFAGDNFAFALLETGELYAWGDNRMGQLGLGDTVQRNEPRLVPNVSDVKEISSGQEHTLLVTHSGELYSTGSDGEGQLGIGGNQANPDPISVVFPPVVSIATANNGEFTVKDTLSVKGTVAVDTPNTEIDMTYTIESKEGKKTFSLGSFTSTDQPENFSINIDLKDYPLGSYTVFVSATARNGASGEATLNFSVKDKLKPTVSIDLLKCDKWATSPVVVNVTAFDEGGSGYRGYRYAITDSTSTPSSWSAIIEKEIDAIVIEKDGGNYLHIEAYDNIGNTTYLRGGPYYLDLSPPSFAFREPEGWQQGRLVLTVNVEDVSGIRVVKWLQGNATLDELKRNGNLLEGNLLEITMNGTYSFYAQDENGQEHTETYKVRNVNSQPFLESTKSRMIIPYADATTSGSLPLTYSHYDVDDAVKAVLTVGNKVYKSVNEDIGIQYSQMVSFDFELKGLTPNTLYEGVVNLEDSRGGVSSEKDIQIEVYDAKLEAVSRKDSITLSWEPSQLGSRYQLLSNGEIVYTGLDTTFTHQTEQGKQYIYQLRVWDGEKYIIGGALNKGAGSILFETPSSILFPSIIIGKSDVISPIDMDKEYVKFEDFSDQPTAYSLRVSVSEFISSEGNSFTPLSSIWRNVKQLNRSGYVEKTVDIPLSSTPYEIVSAADTAKDSFTKLEFLKENLELMFPRDIKLSSNGAEKFRSEITWDITYGP